MVRLSFQICRIHPTIAQTDNPILAAPPAFSNTRGAAGLIVLAQSYVITRGLAPFKSALDRPLNGAHLGRLIYVDSE
jgi:hypothetical protein